MKAVVMVWMVEDDADPEAMTMHLYDSMDAFCEDECRCLIGYSKTYDVTENETVKITVVDVDDD